MISREDLGASEMSSDPFDFEQPDPKQSQALQSSLWELKSLQNHWHSKVRDAAKFINKPLPKDEIDLSDLLESTFADLLEHALCEKSLEKEIEITPEMRSNVLSCF